MRNLGRMNNRTTPTVVCLYIILAAMLSSRPTPQTGHIITENLLFLTDFSSSTLRNCNGDTALKFRNGKYFLNVWLNQEGKFVFVASYWRNWATLQAGNGNDGPHGGWLKQRPCGTKRRFITTKVVKVEWKWPESSHTVANVESHQ